MFKKNPALLFMTVLLIVFLYSCGEDKPTNPDDKTTVPPVITSLNPSDSAKVGDEVFISGNNFGDAREQSTVSFNGTMVNSAGGYISWTNTAVKVIVPDGATSGNVVVKVKDSVSKGVFLRIYTKEIVDPKDSLEIISIDKDSAKVSSIVTITGIGFGSDQNDSYVSFNETKAESYVSWTNDVIKVYVPKTATSGNITVTVNGKASNGKFFIVIGDVVDKTPKITSISPTSQQVGKQMTIDGSNFGASRADGYVVFGGVNAIDYYSWSDNKIIVNVPENAKSGNLKVYANSKFSNEVAYTVLPATVGDPVILGLDASKVQIGTTLGITGQDFGDSQCANCWVQFGTVKATKYNSWTNTKIIVVVPDGAITSTVRVSVEGKLSNGFPITIQTDDNVVSTALIPKGSFKMGPFTDAFGEQPEHQVNITYNFYMSKSEITQETYKIVMSQANPSKLKNDKNPVEQVTWLQACDFCNRLSKMEGYANCYTINGSTVTCNFNANGYRLPTEAEWEYACRAGSTNDPSPLEDYAWTVENSGEGPQPVMQKTANDWGLFDMLGNVYEWCWDNSSPFYYDESPSDDPKGPSEDIGDKVVRGGSFLNSTDLATSRSRSSYGYDQFNLNVGFRVVRKKF
jgi:formylglycine-generating enzyme